MNEQQIEALRAAFHANLAYMIEPFGTEREDELRKASIDADMELYRLEVPIDKIRSLNKLVDDASHGFRKITGEAE